MPEGPSPPNNVAPAIFILSVTVALFAGGLPTQRSSLRSPSSSLKKFSRRLQERDSTGGGVRGPGAQIIAQEKKKTRRRYIRKLDRRRQLQKAKQKKHRPNARQRRELRRQKMRRVLGDIRPWKIDMGAYTLSMRAQDELHNPKLSFQRSDFHGVSSRGAGSEGSWRDLAQFEDEEDAGGGGMTTQRGPRNGSRGEASSSFPSASSSRAETGDDGLIEALWGVHGQEVRVEKHLKPKIRDGALVIPGKTLLSAFLPDPCPSKSKRLTLKFRVSGKIRKFTLNDYVATPKAVFLGSMERQRVGKHSYVEDFVRLHRYVYTDVRDVANPKTDGEIEERSLAETQNNHCNEQRSSIRQNDMGYPLETHHNYANALIRQLGRVVLHKPTVRGLKQQPQQSEEAEDGAEDGCGDEDDAEEDEDELEQSLSDTPLTSADDEDEKSDDDDDDEDDSASDSPDSEEIERKRQDKNRRRRALMERNITKSFKQDDWEKASRTLFVGNVPVDTKIQHIRKFFSARFGPVESARMRSMTPQSVKLSKRVAYLGKKLKAGRDTANAYVVFRNSSSVGHAVQKNMDLKFDGHFLRLDYANHTQKRHDHKHSLFIGNLHPNASEQQLIQIFKPYGRIVNVRIVRDPMTRVSKGFGYVTMAANADFGRAMRLNEVAEIEGRRMRVRKSNPKKATEGDAKIRREAEKKKGLEDRSPFILGRHWKAKMIKERKKRKGVVHKVQKKRLKNFERKLRSGKATWRSPKNPITKSQNRRY